MSKRPQLFGKTLFTDFLLSNLAILLGLMMLMDASRKMRTMEEQKANIQAEGKFVVIMTWPDGSSDDVDLHVMSPTGNDVYYSSREVDLMNLDRDDLGTRGDYVATVNGTITDEKNEERTTLRGIIPGEYCVNVHMYKKSSEGATPVTIVLYKLIGNDTEVVRRVKTLTFTGDEQTAFRFTLDANGTVSDVNDLPRSFIGRPPPGPDQTRGVR